MEKGRGNGKDTLQTANVYTRKEYIEREAAIKAIKSVPNGNWKSIRYARELKTVPAADVMPVRHGKWLEHRTWAKCSECEYLIGFETTYCPNCGARMDGDGE